MINSAIPVFRRQFLQQTKVDSLTSDPVAAEGNEVVLAVTAINVTGGSLTLSLEGSYDGLAWDNLATATALTDFGFTTVAKAALDVAWVRVRAVAGTSATAIFDATVSFSEQ